MSVLNISREKNLFQSADGAAFITPSKFFFLGHRARSLFGTRKTQPVSAAIFE